MNRGFRSSDPHKMAMFALGTSRGQIGMPHSCRLRPARRRVVPRTLRRGVKWPQSHQSYGHSGIHIKALTKTIDL
jgi:hypothetical protein